MSTPPPPLKAVTLTHVRYRRGDPIGHLLAWISLIPIFIFLGGFLSHFLFRRGLQGLLLALGLIISQILNELVKTSVKQSRPSDTCAALETCDSHGRPSSHSQYMLFFAVYLTLLLARKARRWSTCLGAVVAWLSAGMIMLSRVVLGYHTVSQVFAGAALGIILGAGWFWIVNHILVDYFPVIEECVIGRFLYIKDSSHIPNVLKFGFHNAIAVRKKLATD